MKTVFAKKKKKRMKGGNAVLVFMGEIVMFDIICGGVIKKKQKKNAFALGYKSARLSGE